MAVSNINQMAGTSHQPPAARRDAQGRIEPASLADVIGWFLNYDGRVAVINYPTVEALFQWKQQEARRLDADAYTFDCAEDRLAVGIMQALTEHGNEQALYSWIKELLGALDEATKTNEAMASDYGLAPDEETSVMSEAEKIPAARERALYLTACWLETLCTAEVRVLGWVYQQLYGRPFHPNNF